MGSRALKVIKKPNKVRKKKFLKLSWYRRPRLRRISLKKRKKKRRPRKRRTGRSCWMTLLPICPKRTNASNAKRRSVLLHPLSANTADSTSAGTTS